MAKLSTTSINIGSAPGGLGDGDNLRTGGGYINTNTTNTTAAINELASGNWEVDNSSETLALGEQVIAQAHAGITKTLPSATALVTDDFNHIIIVNLDTDSDITVAPQATEEIFVDGATLGASTSHTLPFGYMALCVLRASGDWNLLQIPVHQLALSLLDDVTITGIASGEILKWDGSGWVNNTLEEADVVDRAAAATEKNIAIIHETRATATGTEIIDITTDPSVYIPVGGSSVVIQFDSSAVSLPERGLADLSLIHISEPTRPY